MLNTKIGAIAEQKSMVFLIDNGLQIIAQNYKALPYGEIDIIALDNDVLVFVEVKYRKQTTFARAEETIIASKCNKIINTANIFLHKNIQYENLECRFDVIAINGADINWIKAAFGDM